MKRWFKRLTPLAVLAVAVAVSYYFFATAPQPKRRAPQPHVPLVEVLEVQPTDYRIRVQSSGTVSPATQSSLVSEVSGRILRVGSSFQNGGFFTKDELLIEIEPEEYRLALANIDAELQGVKARLAELAVKAGNLQKSLEIELEHLALVEDQFQRQQRLRKQGTVSQSALELSRREYLSRKSALRGLRNDLDLIPAQRRILESEVLLKKAMRDRAELDLIRTRILAPFAGRVLEKQVDIGQSVAKGSALAEIYATGSAEVRLPVNEREAVMLPLSGLGPDGGGPSTPAPVTLFNEIGERRVEWQGRIVRTEGAIDSKTRQRFLVARVEHPFTASAGGRPPLQVGQYVQAAIPGRILSGVFVIPRKAVRANDQVVTVAADGRIERRQLQLVWKDRSAVVAAGGLAAGERISLTALPYAPDGSRVRVKGEGEKPRRPQKETP